MQHIVVPDAILANFEEIRYKNDLFISDCGLNIEPFFRVLGFGLKVLLIFEEGRLDKVYMIFR